MSNEWQTISDPTFIKWNGQTLEGTWRGISPGKFGPIGTVESPADGFVQFGLPTVLADKLETVKEGATVRIIHHGLHESRAGRSYHRFTVQIAAEGK